MRVWGCGKEVLKWEDEAQAEWCRIIETSTGGLLAMERNIVANFR